MVRYPRPLQEQVNDVAIFASWLGVSMALLLISREVGRFEKNWLNAALDSFTPDELPVRIPQVNPRRRDHGAKVRPLFEIAAEAYFSDDAGYRAAETQAAAQKALYRCLGIEYDPEIAFGETERWFSYFSLYLAGRLLREGKLDDAKQIMIDQKETYSLSHAESLGIVADYGRKRADELYASVNSAVRALNRGRVSQAISYLKLAEDLQYHLAVGRAGTIAPGPQLSPHTLLVEGGELVPPQYRDLVSLVSEPLPEYSLTTLPAVVPEAGERKIDAVLKQLKDGVEGIQDSEQFRLFLGAMSKFHDYSIGNLILIALQKPDATKVAGFNTWKDLGRWVKKGEKGIAILAPVMPSVQLKCPICERVFTEKTLRTHLSEFHQRVDVSELIRLAKSEAEPVGITTTHFKVVYVFDLSQTEGKELPEFRVPALTGEANEELFGRVMSLSRSQGVTVTFEPRPYQDPGVKGQYSGKSIWVKPDEPRAQQLKTLLHEIAHYYSEGVFRIPRQDAETIAESAAYVIGAHYGFDTGVRSFPYVALWAKDKKVLEQNLGAVRRVATTILGEVEKLK